ncbi:hypothetical protein [Xanthomonas sp. CFBP 7698]|uniref:hypothetical protein n=1 Tax=Xanthomonas sp. CFBP 7698 TaxID=2082399 RepID=UPI0011C42D30|nr:hypothetical protein [Xanthomonas sp. CFBP 7698]
MQRNQLLETIIYADRGYIADMYESLTGMHPQTTITKNQGKKAGASIQLFSAELSATETRSYAISSNQMLAEILPFLEEDSEIYGDALAEKMASKIGWTHGTLTILSTSTSFTKRDTGESITTAKDQFFCINGKNGLDIALVSNPSYFAHGLDTLLRMQKTALSHLSIPVRAYVRIFSAKTYTPQWVAVPLLIKERGSER